MVTSQTADCVVICFYFKPLSKSSYDTSLTVRSRGAQDRLPVCGITFPGKERGHLATAI